MKPLVAFICALAAGLALGASPFSGSNSPTSITGSPSVSGDLLVSGDAGVLGSTALTGQLTCKNDAGVLNDFYVGHALTVQGDAGILGNELVMGRLTISNDSDPGLRIIGTTSGTRAIEVPSGARICLDGTTHTSCIFNNGGTVSASDLNALSSVSMGTNLGVGTFITQTPMTLNTCSDPAEFRNENDATGGKANGKSPKPCICDAQQAKWRNTLNPVATGLGTSTTCPDTL